MYPYNETLRVPLRPARRGGTKIERAARDARRRHPNRVHRREWQRVPREVILGLACAVALAAIVFFCATRLDGAVHEYGRQLEACKHNGGRYVYSQAHQRYFCTYTYNVEGAGV